MKQATQKKIIRRPLSLKMWHRVFEGLFILSIAFALFLLVSFVTYHSTDPSWSNTGIEGKMIVNAGGRAGAYLADIFLSLFGCMAFVLPLLIIFAGWLAVREKLEDKPFNLSDFLFKLTGFWLIILSCCGIAGIYLSALSKKFPAYLGGMTGDVLRIWLTSIFNHTGSGLLLMATMLCGITLFTGFSWLGFAAIIGEKVMSLFEKISFFDSVSKKTIINNRESIIEKPEVFIKKPIMTPVSGEQRTVISEPIAKSKLKLTTPKIESSVIVKSGTVPPFTLLNLPPPSEGKAFSQVTFEELSALVEQRLLDFGVETKVVAVHPGPIITRFELELAPGVKVSKISGLAKDIARSLSAISVRVVEVIPGKSVIGLELPNEHREWVVLRDILESPRYAQAKSPISLSLGKDIAGFPVVVDLAKMPHLLVAGTTGSGKSVSLNVMLLSMLFKATPEQLRLILIDPKMLELSVYEGIPHLLTPVITDMKDAANALRWCVAEMDRRYKLMAFVGVRNLPSFNLKVQEGIKHDDPVAPPPWLVDENNQPMPLTSLPMIVVVVDELADMMMVVGKKVEDLVTRIAQKARAAGIHLILATQRPSVDVITGLIKANIPTRIAFQVSSRIDSRTILDQQGAEQLIGNGDMLYLPPGTGVPVRVHGAYVTDEEVHRVVAAWQTYGKPTYLEEITEDPSEHGGTGEANGEMDPLYDEALKIVTESRRASISLIQRRLKIGYNRAARIMEDMEAAGVVSSMDNSGSREVLAPPPVGA